MRHVLFSFAFLCSIGIPASGWASPHTETAPSGPAPSGSNRSPEGRYVLERIQPPSVNPTPHLTTQEGIQAQTVLSTGSNTVIMTGAWRCPSGFTAALVCGSGGYWNSSVPRESQLPRIPCACTTTAPNGNNPGTFTCTLNGNSQYMDAYLQCTTPYVEGRLNYYYDAGTGSLIVDGLMPEPIQGLDRLYIPNASAYPDPPRDE